MPAVEYRYEEPDRFIAGTVGEPGSRTFFLQARAGSRLTSVALEKQQVSILADRMESLVARVPTEDLSSIEDGGPLDLPIEEEFRVGTMTLTWEHDTGHVVVEAFPAGVEEGEDAEEVLVVHVTLAQARGFVERARAVVSAGRPACQFCGGPMDPEGHLCPRANGFRRSVG
jgi:uncharacterized repeat protein (TIGR03847 family)